METKAAVNLETPSPREIGTSLPSHIAHNKPAQTHTCKNCGTSLAGEYCHGCGQSAHVHRSFLHVLEEALHGITHFDSKTWRSLPMLIFRPGTLTRNYVMGHRSRYVQPFSMFLASIFAMFLAFAFAGDPGFVRQTTSTQADRVAEASLTELANERKMAFQDGDKVAVAALDTATAFVKASPPTQTANTQTLELSSDGDGQAAFAKFLSEDVKINTPWPTLNKKIKHKLENPELLLYKLQNTAYKFSFLLIPLSLPFIWLLLFWKRGVTLYDHSVFVLYSVSFMSFLFLSLAISAHWIVWGDYLGWVFLAVLAHIYFQFKGAYDLNWFSALWRTGVFVFVFAPISLILFLGSVAALGAVG
jgi:hypothetical protein